jgi:TonB-linked SusC/RagA family outer membrane protein
MRRSLLLLLLGTFCTAMAVAQHTVTGTVTGAKGNPLDAATVKEKGVANNVVQTKDDGSFSIVLKGSEDALEVSFVVYKNQTVRLNGQTTVSVVLEDAEATTQEVVVVGYATQKKANLTGAVSSVGSKQLENRPVTSLGNALQGTMAGVTVTASASGQPGRDAGTIRVRGIGTLNNSNAMVVVDGIISAMNNVNPDDVESITVLKDAASAAIYGSRAANGVILITTKKGKKGVAQVNYSAYAGKQQATGMYDFLPSWQAATLYTQALRNQGISSGGYTDAEIQKFKDGSDPYNYPNTDWLDLGFQGSGFQQNHYVGVNGGSEKTRYMLSLGYFDQDGLMVKTNSKRYTTRLNINSDVNSRLKVNGNVAYTISNIKEPQSSYPGVPGFTQIVRQLNRISNIVPYKFENGHYGSITDGNPVAWLESPSFNNENYYDLAGNLGLDYELVSGLHIKPTIGYVSTNSGYKTFVADIQYYNANGNATFYQGPNSVTDRNSSFNRLTLQTVADYTKSIGDHNFKLLGGYSQEFSSYKENSGFRKGFLNNELSEINLGSTDGQTTSGWSYELALRSWFGRLNYDFDGKYMFEANLRYDATSRFNPNTRWGTFPAFSVGWNVDKENFFAPLENVFSSLKVRGSWGKLGNQEVAGSGSFPYYPYITTIRAGQDYTFNNEIAAGVSPVNGANENIKWESTTNTGVGIDATLLRKKLNVTVDWFNRKTNDILMAIPVGGAYGLSAPVVNAAAVQNRGWEFVVGYNDKKGAFNYNASFNISVIDNKITNLAGTGAVISGSTIQDVGLPINSLYGYIAEGIFQTTDEVAKHASQGTRTAPGDIKYKDVNGDGVITTSDKQYLGNYYPKTTFGLTLGASWKGIDLSVFLQGATGVKTYIEGKLGEINNGPGKPTSALWDSWTPENPNASMPRVLSSWNQNSPTANPSTFWVKDGSYVRLKNIQLGYTIPGKLTNKIGVSKARFYYSGQNVLTITNLYDWIDPEAPRSSGIYYYPQVKLHTVGVNVTF